MSSYIDPCFGLIQRIWLSEKEGHSLLLVEETRERLQYLVFYQSDNGIWKVVREFAVGFPSPLALEVDATYGMILFAGYPVSGKLSPLLVIEEDGSSRWFLLYTLETGYWVLSEQYQLALTPVKEGLTNNCGTGKVKNGGNIGT